MKREEYINNFKEHYKFVSILSEKFEYKIYRFRNKALEKDIILRSYPEPIKAYEKLTTLHSENLPEIYEAITLEDGQIVLEEYIEGITVAEVLEVKKYKYKEAKKILNSLCNSLFALHSNGLVHRDIKPENIIIDEQGKVFLIDLNTSRAVSNSNKDTVIMGTVGYVSPEQLGITQSDYRTDIYALGILLNVMLTGKHPSEKLAKGKARRIIRKCTNLNPNDRYQSVESLSGALKNPLF